jgi:ParB family chromosome partitioning protein
VSKERRLGRGLEALLGSLDHAPSTPAGGAAGHPTVSVFDIDPNPFQPRKDFDAAEIEALAESLRRHGLLQPLLVRKVGERYQLVAGERRLRAARQAGWSDVPVRIVEADDRRAAEFAIVENLQRKDLNPLEKASSFQQHLARYGCTQEELAARLSLDRSTIANLIRLLELPEPVQEAVRRGRISQGHARALLPLGDEAQQAAFCRSIEEQGLSVRATEELVQRAIQQEDGDPAEAAAASYSRRRARTRRQHLAALAGELRAALGAKVEVSSSASGRGRIVIHFADHAEFERLRGLLCAGRLGEGLLDAA